MFKLILKKKSYKNTKWLAEGLLEAECLSYGSRFPKPLGDFGDRSFTESSSLAALWIILQIITLHYLFIGNALKHSINQLPN